MGNKKTEQEKIAYIESLIPEFKKHKQAILDAYGIDKYLKITKERLSLFNRLLAEAKIDNPDMNIEDIVNYFNDQVDKRCIAEGGDIIDNIYNKQLNIIIGMRIRGYEI